MQNNVRGVRNPNEYNKTKPGPLHYVLSSDDEVCIWFPVKHFEALVIYYWQMQKKATSVRQLEKKQKRSSQKKKKNNKQAMLLQKTKAPLSQICLNFWQQRKLNNMAFFFL